MYGQCDFFVTFCIVQSFVLSMYEIRNASYTELDFRFTYELCSVPNIIGVIYATCTMDAVRILKYKEENSHKNVKVSNSRNKCTILYSRDKCIYYIKK